MAENKVQLEIFEGPLDLLLYLVKKEEVDIYQVNLTKIATQFIQYVEVLREMDLDIAGDFLVMAATLMYIKSRELLPVDQQAQVEEEDDGVDPRWELIRQLVEYKKFKDAAAKLQQREEDQADIYPRIAPKPVFPVERSGEPATLSVFDLVSAVSTILKRFAEKEPGRDVYEDKFSVSEKIEHLAGLLREKGHLKFSELFADNTSRSEVVVTFLALLELIRLKQLRATQPEEFSEIEIALAAPLPAREPESAVPDAGMV